LLGAGSIGLNRHRPAEQRDEFASLHALPSGRGAQPTTLFE
jgi:hypothetical protein